MINPWYVTQNHYEPCYQAKYYYETSRYACSTQNLTKYYVSVFSLTASFIVHVSTHTQAIIATSSSINVALLLILLRDVIENKGGKESTFISTKAYDHFMNLDNFRSHIGTSSTSEAITYINQRLSMNNSSRNDSCNKHLQYMICTIGLLVTVHTYRDLSIT